MIDSYMSKVKQIEASIISGLQKGDSYAFELLYDNYYDDLCFFLSRIGADTSLSKDMVQEVFIKLWKKRTSLNINSSLSNYLHKSVYNQYLMHLRELKKQRSVLDALREDAIFEFYIKEDPVEDIRLQRLKEAIEALPPKCKEAFILSKFENRKYKEVAVLMGISVKTVEIHVSKALGLLRKIQFLF